jgi:hypothetical protein
VAARSSPAAAPAWAARSRAASADGGAAVAIVDLLATAHPDGAGSHQGGRPRAFIPADVSRWDDVDRAVGEAVRQLGPSPSS